MIDPVALATITSAVSVLASDYGKGIANEAGKASWAGIKSLFGWKSDPAPAEIPEKVTTALTASPEMTEKLLELLKSHQTGTATLMVGHIEARDGGKVVVIGTVNTTNFTV